jgi:glucose/mannose-6-phosphate isomerase
MGMLEATLGMPEQIVDAVAGVDKVGGLPAHDEIENVLVVGMGGSGIAGDIAGVIAGPLMPVPVLTHKGYGLPAFVNERTLVLAVSFSGDTEETLEAAVEAHAAGGRVVAIARGGELGRFADAAGLALVPVDGAIPAPRAALGALALPVLAVLDRVGLFPGAASWIDAAVDQLRRRRDQLAADANAAEALARRVGRLTPLVYGGGGVGAVSALRWKTQFNENAKVAAFANVVPEICHNEICGWGQNGDVTRQVFEVIELRHDFEHPQIGRRFELVNAVLDEVVADIAEVVAEGEGALAQLLDLMLFGDVVSIHRALQEGVDPGPVPVLDDIKRQLASG